MRYINFDNLMNESLSFRAILTKVTFVTTSVASLMLNSICFDVVLPLGTFILGHVPQASSPCDHGYLEMVAHDLRLSIDLILSLAFHFLS